MSPPPLLPPSSSSVEQLWKINDQKANKEGQCQSIYWVHPSPPPTEIRRGPPRTDKSFDVSRVYKGEWSNNRRDGYGCMVWKNGNKYEGQWHNSKRDGHGILWVKIRTMSKEQEELEAEIDRNHGRRGKRPHQEKLRRVYAGYWKDDKKEGNGIYFFKDGSRYEGSWVNNVRQGRGVLIYPDGTRYIGDWHNDEQTGFGTLLRPNGDIYEGEWSKGKREGQGIFFWREKGRIYDGEWVNDAPRCGVACDASEFFAHRRTRDSTSSPSHGGDGSGSSASSSPTSSSSSPNSTIDMLAASGTFARSSSGPLPRLRLLDPDGMLAARIETIQLERAAARALPFTPLTSLYADAHLMLFESIFHQHIAEGAGVVPTTTAGASSTAASTTTKTGASSAAKAGASSDSSTRSDGSDARLRRAVLRAIVQECLQVRPAVKEDEIDVTLHEIGRDDAVRSWSSVMSAASAQYAASVVASLATASAVAASSAHPGHFPGGGGGGGASAAAAAAGLTSGSASASAAAGITAASGSSSHRRYSTTSGVGSRQDEADAAAAVAHAIAAAAAVEASIGGPVAAVATATRNTAELAIINAPIAFHELVHVCWLVEQSRWVEQMKRMREELQQRQQQQLLQQQQLQQHFAAANGGGGGGDAASGGVEEDEEVRALRYQLEQQAGIHAGHHGAHEDSDVGAEEGHFGHEEGDDERRSDAHVRFAVA